MPSNPDHHERLLLAAIAALLVLACLGPALAQPADHHHFADARALWGIPCALDVLSNLPFALLGLVGLYWLAVAQGARGDRVDTAQTFCAALFFGGLAATAAASSWYHLRPDDAGLALDRLGMALAFAGVLGLAAADRVSARAGGALALALLVLGPLSVQVWASTGNVLPWAVLQLGGLLVLAGLALLRPLPGALAVRWGLVIGVYAVAKLLEQADHAVFALTSGAVSGHSLKHLVASLAALPIIMALHRVAKAGQNAAEAHTTKVADNQQPRNA